MEGCWKDRVLRGSLAVRLLVTTLAGAWFCSAGCGARRAAPLDASMDQALLADSGSARDTAGADQLVDAPRDALVTFDAAMLDAPGPDAGGCYCKPGEVWHMGSCTPTVKLGCGPSCDPANPTTCPNGETCNSCAAAA